MTTRDKILYFINDFLNVADFEDYCTNGLQVEGKQQIEKIVLGVSSSERLFVEAVNRNADMIIVHHGLFWKNDPLPFSLIGIVRNRLALLLKNDINLAGYHLPLDAHPEIGNNAQLIKLLNLEIILAADVGFLCKLHSPTTFPSFVKLAEQKLDTKTMSFPFGNDQVSQVLVISGSGSSYYPMAIELGADTFITGDIRESQVRAIEEVSLNLIIAGHYNTEKLGVQALGRVLEQQFDVSCEFIDIPNPI